MRIRNKKYHMKKYLKYTFTFGIIKRLLIIIFLLSNFSFGQSIEQQIENLITKYNKENQLSRQWFHKHVELITENISQRKELQN